MKSRDVNFKFLKGLTWKKQYKDTTSGTKLHLGYLGDLKMFSITCLPRESGDGYLLRCGLSMHNQWKTIEVSSLLAGKREATKMLWKWIELQYCNHRGVG